MQRINTSGGLGLHFRAFSHIIAMVLLSAGLLFLPVSCHNSELWNDLPAGASEFINTYYPMSELESATHSGSYYHARLSNGPGFTFDSSGSWVAVDGYGLPLPQVMLFDCLPPAMYEYLQEAELLNGVFAIARDGDVYSATLLESTLRYNVATGTLDGTVPKASFPQR